MIVAGPWASTAIGGSPHAIPSTITWPNCSRTDGRTTTSDAFSAVGQVVVAAPAGQEDVLDAGLADHLERVLALPLPRVAAEQHERRADVEPLARARVRADQQRDALDLGVAADVEQHRARRRTPPGRPRRRTTLPGSSSSGAQPRGSSTSQLAPQRRGGRRRRSGGGRRSPGRTRSAPRRPCPGRRPSRSGTRRTASGERTSSRSHELRPAAHPVGPLLRVVPALGRALVDLAQHQQLGAVQVADPRDVREGALGRLVHRRQVVQVDAGRRRPRRPRAAASPRRRPGARRSRRRPSRRRGRARPRGPRTTGACGGSARSGSSASSAVRVVDRPHVEALEEARRRRPRPWRDPTTIVGSQPLSGRFRAR